MQYPFAKLHTSIHSWIPTSSPTRTPEVRSGHTSLLPAVEVGYHPRSIPVRDIARAVITPPYADIYIWDAIHSVCSTSTASQGDLQGRRASEDAHGSTRHTYHLSADRVPYRRSISRGSTVQGCRCRMITIHCEAYSWTEYAPQVPIRTWIAHLSQTDSPCMTDGYAPTIRRGSYEYAPDEDRPRDL